MTPFRLSTRTLSPRPGTVPAPVSVPVPVPWRVTARSLGVIEIEHRGTHDAHSVRFALAGGGMLGLTLPRTVRPGERVRVAVRGRAADNVRSSSDAMLVMRWYQPDGTELLWPIALE